MKIVWSCCGRPKTGNGSGYLEEFYILAKAA